WPGGTSGSGLLDGPVAGRRRDPRRLLGPVAARRPRAVRPAPVPARAPGPPLSRPRGGPGMATDTKIRTGHLRRPAVRYARQSPPHQAGGNRESTVRQYALVDRARALGWPAAAVQTIDEDQGRSGARSDHRDGFKRLLAEIGAGQVGLVLALEASRLARSPADWHRAGAGWGV